MSLLMAESSTIVEKNFKFLEKQLPELAILGDFAEQYVYADPSSSAVKLRLFAEKVAGIISTILNLPKEYEESNLYNIISTNEFKNSVPDCPFCISIV